MVSYRDMSIRHKLQGIIIITCGVSLILASIAFTLYDRANILRTRMEDLTAGAEMIGLNSTAGLTFGDASSVREILNSLRAKPQVINACVYDKTGNIFAAYSRSGEAPPCPTPPPGVQSAATGGRLILSRNITLHGEVIGTIHIEDDLSDVQQLTEQFIGIAILVLMGALGVAYVLSFRLQRIISNPIRELAYTALAVTARENYSIRVKKHGQDEIGFLFDQFNGMLDRIHQRDVALQRIHEQLEQRVAQRTAYLNALIDNNPLAIVVVDKDGNIKLCNSAFERMFQYSREEVVGKPVKGLLSDQPLLVTTGPAVTATTERRRKDGSLLDVEIHSVGLTVNGETAGTLAIYQDISIRKAAEAAMARAKEAAETASRAKSEFLANMSHEIRTPMNGIMGMTELVLDTHLDPEQREYLNLAKSSADSLLSLINDILDYSKIEAGRLEIDSISFNLGDSLGDTMRTLSLRAHQKNLELAFEVQPDVPDGLIGDPGRLRQVIVNLVGNAIKFTDKGEVVVYVETESRTADDIQLHFTVADTGIGIPKEKQASIFEAFRQADGSMSRKYGGTGLGLTISSRLLNLMNGRIWVESEPGLGSRFHFTVRFGLQKTPTRTVVPRTPAALRDMRVLIVDDNATNRHILVKILENWHMKPTDAESGARAIVLLREAIGIEEHFPLILLDAQMPVMDGFALAEQIKRQPEWAAATVMMLSSAGQRGDAIRCRELGIAAYLTKPIRPSELLDAILMALSVAPRGESPAALVTRHSIRESQHHLRILLAEDNSVNQMLAVRLLQRRGHAVTVAANGKEALAALEKHAFDVVLMDVQMPEMDGFEATTIIRQREKQSGAHIPIIAITAHAMVGDRERCLQAGMDAYVSKPLQVADLFDAIEKLCPAGDEVPAHSPSS